MATSFGSASSTNTQLPASGSVDVDRLAGLFRNCTQSYKFLFFRAILEAIRRSSDHRIPFEELLADIVISAWWPVAVSRLSIGNAAGNDTLTALVATIGDVDRGSLDRDAALSVAVASMRANAKRSPLRYVPYRLLEPWENSSTTPIYSIERGSILLHPDWADYLSRNLPVVQGWADHAWCSWVQSRNPNVPVTMEKLVQSSSRRTLHRERTFFLRGMEATTMRCIYTGLTLRPPLHIDHFLPRSFVGHDRIWNLLPTSPEVNSSKGARIPGLQYVDALAAFHADVLKTARNRHEDRNLLEQYCLDLRLAPADLDDPDAVRGAYGSVIPAMMSIASRMGFPSEWRPTNSGPVFGAH